jgi:hypothetical protein
MMEKLMARAGGLARAAQSRRVQQIAARLREQGLAFESDGESLVVRGRQLAQRWLADPLLRFVSARPA